MTEKPHAAHDAGGHGHGHGHDDHGHGDHGHGHGHGSPFIQHHYDDAQHQFDSGKLGIWLFLAQEVLFFSALFVAYILYRHHHPELYAYAHKYLDVKMGAINTAVLIFSSLTAAWAVRCAQLNQKRGLILCIVLTIACACGFLGIKYVEYSHKIHEQILFGPKFDPCVSSGGRPLLTKSNACGGHESSVVWDTATARPLEGCFDAASLDHDTTRDGVQANTCKVFEARGSYQQRGNAQVWVETGRKEVVEKCPDWVPGLEPFAGKKPCWRTSHQPAVCNQGYSYRWTCAGAGCGGDAFGSQGPFATQKECENAANRKKKDLEKAGTVTTTECTRGDTVGFLVEYGGHDPQPADVRIEAMCTEKPKATEPADPLADKAQTIEVGKPQIVAGTTKAPATKLTGHDAKEAVYAGPPPENTNMFFTIYFAMTGLHGIHVLVGVFVFVWLLIRAIKGHFTPDYFGPIDFAALYWHIVDLIWIFLFPLLYLIH